MRVGLGPAPIFLFLCHHVSFILLTLEQDMLVRVDEVDILLVISSLALLSCAIAIPLGDMWMVGWYLCWGPEIARIRVVP